MEYFAIIIGAIFVNNVVLAQFLGICPFLGVSSKVETSLGMGAAVTFVMALTALVCWPLQTYVLNAFDIQYMQTIVFILVIASLVQMVEIILNKDDRLHVLNLESIEHIGLKRPANQGRQCHDESYGSTHTQRGLHLRRYTQEGADAEELCQNNVIYEDGTNDDCEI